MKRNKVAFTQTCTAKCVNCNQLLFQLTDVDQFLKFQNQNYLMLNDMQLHSSLILETSPTPNSLFMFLKNIKCKKCNHKLGFKIHAANIQTVQLLDKILFNIQNLLVFQIDEDLTEKLRTNFDKYLIQQQNVSQVQKEQKQVNGVLQTKQPSVVLEQQNESKQFIKKSPIKRTQLNSAQSLDGEIIEVIRSLDFFSNILSKIDRRVCDLQSVSGILRKKLQQIQKK